MPAIAQPATDTRCGHVLVHVPTGTRYGCPQPAEAAHHGRCRAHGTDPRSQRIVKLSHEMRRLLAARDAARKDGRHDDADYLNEEATVTADAILRTAQLV